MACQCVCYLFWDREASIRPFPGYRTANPLDLAGFGTGDAATALKDGKYIYTPRHVNGIPPYCIQDSRRSWCELGSHLPARPRACPLYTSTGSNSAGLPSTVQHGSLQHSCSERSRPLLHVHGMGNIVLQGCRLTNLCGVILKACPVANTFQRKWNQSRHFRTLPSCELVNICGTPLKARPVAVHRLRRLWPYIHSRQAQVIEHQHGATCGCAHCKPTTP